MSSWWRVFRSVLRRGRRLEVFRQRDCAVHRRSGSRGEVPFLGRTTCAVGIHAWLRMVRVRWSRRGTWFAEFITDLRALTLGCTLRRCRRYHSDSYRTCSSMRLSERSQSRDLSRARSLDLSRAWWSEEDFADNEGFTGARDFRLHSLFVSRRVGDGVSLRICAQWGALLPDLRLEGL